MLAEDAKRVARKLRVDVKLGKRGIAVCMERVAGVCVVVKGCYAYQVEA